MRFGVRWVGDLMDAIDGCIVIKIVMWSDTFWLIQISFASATFRRIVIEIIKMHNDDVLLVMVWKRETVMYMLFSFVDCFDIWFRSWFFGRGTFSLSLVRRYRTDFIQIRCRTISYFWKTTRRSIFGAELKSLHSHTHTHTKYMYSIISKNFINW